MVFLIEFFGSDWFDSARVLGLGCLRYEEVRVEWRDRVDREGVGLSDVMVAAEVRMDWEMDWMMDSLLIDQYQWPHGFMYTVYAFVFVFERARY